MTDVYIEVMTREREDHKDRLNFSFFEGQAHGVRKLTECSFTSGV